MSRLIVKNLPKTVTDEKLRQLFSQKGNVTDVQLKYTDDGKFRHFGFIGFETEEQAKAAVEFLNQSFVNTRRISVELCAGLGDASKPKAWSKYAKDSESYKKLNKPEVEEEPPKKSKDKKTKKSKRDALLEEHKDDPQFAEFLQAHGKNKNIWDNDMEEVGGDQQQTKPRKDSDSGHESTTETTDAPAKLADKPITDEDYMKFLKGEKVATVESQKSITKTWKVDKLYTVKIRNLSPKVTRQDIIKFFGPNKPFSVRQPPKKKDRRWAYAGFKTEDQLRKAVLKHKSFLNGKQVQIMDFTDRNMEHREHTSVQDEQPKNDKHSRWAKQEEALENEEGICDSGKLFFRNLPYTVQEKDLREVFEEHGPVADISLPLDSFTRKIKGFGTVTFMMPEHAVMAYTALNGTMFHGRMFHLMPGKANDHTEEDPDAAGLSFKEKKALKLKKEAGQSFNWNTLFLGNDAVANILAKTYDTSKEQILDTSAGGSSAAVRLALGETEIVLNLKQFMADNDVCLDAFNAPTTPQKRSNTVIIVKNLPSGTEVSDLQKTFAPFGLLGRVLLPPNCVTAIVEFLEPSEAKKAFYKLAYTKFKNLPLYLEWAPENTFTTAPKVPTQATQTVTTKKEEVKEEEIVQEPKEEEEENDEDDTVEPDTTLFIRNLNFTTIEPQIREHFKHIGPIHMVQIAKKKDPSNPGNFLSFGYGFIQFRRKASAEKALRELQNSELEGKVIELNRSDKTLKSDAKKEVNNARKDAKKGGDKQQTGTKMLVRNIPFQAKSSEVYDLFKAFGEIKSLRLPKKMTPGAESHRGFGFVEFHTKSDAKKAFNALCQSTHLYGRRLVLEWAAAEDDVETLRKRTADHFTQSNSKRSRKGVFDASEIDAVLSKNAMDNDDDDE